VTALADGNARDAGRPACAGRDAEIRALAGALTRVRAGRFGAAAIYGEPGIGKTQLLGLLADMAADAGWQVWRGTGTEFERNMPYGLYVDACADLAGEPPVGRLLAAARGADTGPDRYFLHRDLHAMLAERARRQPAVLLLDDLHWADPASVELTGHLLRRPPRAPLLLALASRPASLPAPVAEAVARLGSAATILRLASLSAEAVAALAPGAGEHRRRLLYDASRGNPLYLQVLAHLPDRALADLVDDATGAEPEQALPRVLRAELDRLDPELRTVAHAVAIAGEHATLGLIAAIAGRDEDDVAAALDRLGDSGTLAGAAGCWQFRHPLLRAAAYWQAGAGARTRAHTRAAHYLRERAASPALLAHHTARCAQHGDRAAVAVMRNTAQAVLHTAPASAAHLLRTALRVLPEQAGPDRERAALTMSLARALAAIGELEEARRLVTEAIRLDGGQPGPAFAFASLVSRLLGQLDTGRALLTDGLRNLPPDGRATAQALVELAATDVLSADPAAARDSARRALDLLTATDDPALTAAAHALLALAWLQGGEVPAGRAAAATANRLLTGATDPQLAEHIELIAPLAWVQLHLQEHATAERQLARGLDVAHRYRISHPLPYLLIVRSAVRHRRGDLAGAVRSAREAAEMSYSMGSAETAAMARGMALVPVLWQDGPRAARRLADELVQAGPPASSWWAGVVAVGLDTVAVAAGTGLGATDTALGDTALGDTALGDTAVYRLALRAVVAGDAAVAQAALVAAERIGLAHQRGTAHDGYARVLLRTGDPAGAVEHARRAVEAFTAAGSPVEEGRSRELLAEAYAKDGAAAADRYAELGRAKALYASCGARWLTRELARTEARLSAAAPRGPRRPPGAAGVLTDRERQVAELASEGVTNREIAVRLRLSPKTVETHLTRAFAKLDVHSRIALGRRLR
jgi:DNA-binding CsgD family transcriptional regulator/tetratricopeptide (TPR) repeat protein